MMFQRPRIVFPFQGNQLSLQAYAWAKELAAKVRLPFYVFCSLAPEHRYSKIHVYHEMLEADGFYFTHYTGTPSDKTHIRMSTGDFVSNLQAYLKKHPADIVVVDPMQTYLNESNRDRFMSYPNGLVFLRNTDSINETDEAFASLLNRAETHHLPPNFYHTIHHKPYITELFLSMLGRRN